MSIAISDLRAVVRYSPDTGILYWRQRSLRFFGGVRPAHSRAAWNGRFADKPINGTESEHGYIRIYVLREPHFAHRVAWAAFYGEWPTQGIDHINREKQDNRITNLRLCNQSQNMFNTGLFRHNTSGYRGVRFVDRYKAWHAILNHNGRKHSLGFFPTAEEAAKAYSAAVKQAAGEFAPTEGVWTDD